MNQFMTRFITAGLAIGICFFSMEIWAAEGFVLNTGEKTPNGAILFAGDGTVREGAAKRDCLVGYRISLDQASNQNLYTRFLKLIAAKEYVCTIEKKPDEMLVYADIADQTQLIIRFESNNHCTWHFKLSDKSTLPEKVSQPAPCGEFGKVEY
jgi:hypothetical protein